MPYPVHRMLLAGFISCAVLCAPLRAQDQQTSADAFSRSLAGCYELHIGPWPGDSAGNKYTIPPSAVELTLVLAEMGISGMPVFLAKLARNAQPTIHRVLYWQPDSARRYVEMGFSTGLSGVALKFTVRGDSLTGVAHDFWDFTDRHSEAPARALRRPC
jgi:hypothetical protein